MAARADGGYGIAWKEIRPRDDDPLSPDGTWAMVQRMNSRGNPVGTATILDPDGDGVGRIVGGYQDSGGRALFAFDPAPAHGAIGPEDEWFRIGEMGENRTDLFPADVVHLLSSEEPAGISIGDVALLPR